MKRYWIRISLGALGIFVLGMLLVNMGRRGVDRVKELAMQHSLSITPGVAPFQVDNRRLGTLTQVEMDPDQDTDFPFINLTVQLDSNMETAGLEDCVLLASDREALNGAQGLLCSAAASRDSLVEIGAVTFEPTGENRSIYIPASELDGKSWFKHVSQVTRVVNAPSPEGSFNLQADASGAFMLIKDEKGRPIFQLNADSQGAFIQIRDSNGKEVVRFRADSQGVVGRVQPN